MVLSHDRYIFQYSYSLLHLQHPCSKVVLHSSKGQGESLQLQNHHSPPGDLPRNQAHVPSCCLLLVRGTHQSGHSYFLFLAIIWLALSTRPLPSAILGQKMCSWVHIAFFSCCLVTPSCLTLQPQGLQHTRLPCPSLSPRVCLNSCPLSQRYYTAISLSVAPSLLGLSLPSLRVFFFQWVGSSHQVAKSSSILELQPQHQSFQWVVRVDFL